nr:ankyrin repeat-containing protein itn1 [Quercus suber]
MQILTFWALGSTPISGKGEKTILRKAREPLNLERIKDRVDIYSLIAVLVATVTFAAGLTVPGGFNSSGESQGLATLGNKWAFQVFIISDSTAMYCSVAGTFFLIWSLVARDVAKSAIWIALRLLGAAIFAMSVAFMSAIYLVVSNISWVVYLVSFMGIFYLCWFILTFIAMVIPFEINHPIFHAICKFIIPAMLIFVQRLDDHKKSSLSVEKNKQEESPPTNKEKDKQEESQPRNKDRQEEFQQKKH